MKERFKLKDVEAAMRASGGLRTVAAAKLGCSNATITNYCRKHPVLKEIEDEITERHLDLAEHKLISAIKEGDMTAIIFFLKTKGRHRGYSQRMEVTGADGGPIQTELIEASERVAGKLASMLAAARADISQAN